MKKISKNKRDQLKTLKDKSEEQNKTSFMGSLIQDFFIEPSLLEISKGAKAFSFRAFLIRVLFSPVL